MLATIASKLSDEYYAEKQPRSIDFTHQGWWLITITGKRYIFYVTEIWRRFKWHLVQTVDIRVWPEGI